MRWVWLGLGDVELDDAAAELEEGGFLGLADALLGEPEVLAEGGLGDPAGGWCQPEPLGDVEADEPPAKLRGGLRMRCLDVCDDIRRDAVEGFGVGIGGHGGLGGSGFTGG